MNILIQARKEWIQISRDRLTLILALLLPLTTLAILGASISLKVTDLPIVVQDFDNSPLSRRYIDQFRTSLTFRIAPWSVNERMEKALDIGSARAAIIIPVHFEREILRNRKVEVQTLVDATDANTANLIRGNVRSITKAFSDRIDPKVSELKIRPEIRFWFNPGRESKRYIGPGIFAVVLALFPPLLSALAMSRESEQKTMIQVYALGISAREFLSGKLLAYFTIALAEWALTLLLSLLLFDLSFAGDPSPLLIATIFYLVCSVSFGMMIGTIIPDQAAAIQATQVGGFVLSFLMSGLIFPISNIPIAVRWVSIFVPARYYIDITRDAFARGSGWEYCWQSLLMLAILSALFFSISWIKLRRMQVES
jgi:ABC-2 type transport system permease protein